jgi:hypothetical protein
MTSQTLASALEGFFGSDGAVVMEDGAVVFDLQNAKYSVSDEHNKCVIHFGQKNAISYAACSMWRAKAKRYA